jgi:hypothetical protein
MEKRISFSSSPGLLGWMREPKWPEDPIRTPRPGRGLKSFRATAESWSFSMVLTTAAIAGLDSPSR